MKLELYEAYLAHRNAGRKRHANESIRDFVASCSDLSDREAWVRRFLEKGDYEHRIRHEVYAGLIFPVLAEGYARKEFWSVYWLGRTAQNLYAAPSLHAQVEYKVERHFFREAYALNPTDEVRRCLLSAYVSEFQYCQHEWPAGILCGMDGASLEECAEILRDVAFVRTIDDGAHEALLSEFEGRVLAYMERLARPS